MKKINLILTIISISVAGIAFGVYFDPINSAYKTVSSGVPIDATKPQAVVSPDGKEKIENPLPSAQSVQNDDAFINEFVNANKSEVVPKNIEQGNNGEAPVAIGGISGGTNENDVFNQAVNSYNQTAEDIKNNITLYEPQNFDIQTNYSDSFEKAYIRFTWDSPSLLSLEDNDKISDFGYLILSRKKIGNDADDWSDYELVKIIGPGKNLYFLNGGGYSFDWVEKIGNSQQKIEYSLFSFVPYGYKPSYLKPLDTLSKPIIKEIDIGPPQILCSLPGVASVMKNLAYFDKIIINDCKNN